MVDPKKSRFWVSWQIHDPVKEEGGVLEDAEIVGAEAAVAWGQKRADLVFIRLGDNEETWFSAGVVPGDSSIPRWPPAGPPREGWCEAAGPFLGDDFPDGSPKPRP